MKGLLKAINEVEKVYKIPIPSYIREVGLCSICLGSNHPGFKRFSKHEPSKGTFCCGSWCDGLLPFWLLCKRWKLDKEKLKVLIADIRPDGTEIASSSRVV